MGKLGHNWIEKMAYIGWRPNTMEIMAHKFLGDKETETIIGLLHTGDTDGNLIGVSTSHVKNTNRLEKTILGFTIGGDNSIMQRSIVMPENRIPGCLFITSNKFIVSGRENIEYPFSDIIVASGSTRPITTANYDLQKIGCRDYSYAGDIYVSKFELNRQENLNCGYDDLTIAFVINKKPFIGKDIRSTAEVWYQLERTIITKDE
jgi:hypothetical protein